MSWSGRMIAVKGYFSTIVVMSAVFTACFGESELCETDTSLLCVATCSGQKVNISGILVYPIPADNTLDDYVYTFTPCQGYTCSQGSSSDNALCQDPNNGEQGFSLGKTTSATWYLNNTNPYTFTVVFSHGDDERQSHVTFFANESGDSKLVYKGEAPMLNYNFEMQGPNVGQPIGGGGGIAGPIGLALIFVSIGCLCVYFIVGAVLMYFKYGAKGIDIIPNLSFWMDFPFLLRDGFLFVISPCYKRESYTSVK